MEEKSMVLVQLHDTTDHHPIWVNKKTGKTFLSRKKNSRYKDDDFMPLDGPKLQKKRKGNNDIISLNFDQCCQLNVSIDLLYE